MRASSAGFAVGILAIGAPTIDAFVNGPSAASGIVSHMSLRSAVQAHSAMRPSGQRGVGSLTMQQQDKPKSGSRQTVMWSTESKIDQQNERLAEGAKGGRASNRLQDAIVSCHSLSGCVGANRGHSAELRESCRGLREGSVIRRGPRLRTGASPVRPEGTRYIPFPWDWTRLYPGGWAWIPTSSMRVLFRAWIPASSRRMLVCAGSMRMVMCRLPRGSSLSSRRRNELFCVSRALQPHPGTNAAAPCGSGRSSCPPSRTSKPPPPTARRSPQRAPPLWLWCAPPAQTRLGEAGLAHARIPHCAAPPRPVSDIAPPSQSLPHPSDLRAIRRSTPGVSAASARRRRRRTRG
jgi:hypothetical protein